MKEGADHTLSPFDFTQIMEEVPELGKFALKTDSVTFDPLIDSSDVEPSLWVRIAEIIRDRYDSYDGFVILHGTDTMSYSASVLSFMLEGLGKPVIFTGSQLPIGKPRTDGKENLVSAVEIAAARDGEGHALVPEVAVYFGSKLLRGNRTTKVNANAFDAFKSPNLPPLAEAGIDIMYNKAVIRPAREGQKFSVDTRLDTRVSILKIHPGIKPETLEYFLGDPSTRAVIIETYGSGNSISKPWFTDIVRKSTESGKILLNVTQCLKGTVNMQLYATGKTLLDAGVISGRDMTTEGALGKLFHLMAKYDDPEEVKKRLLMDLRGEMSEESL